MTEQSTFQILVPFLSNRSVQVIFSSSDPSYQRAPYDDDEKEAEIDHIWKKRCESNPSLFNASKFRLSHVTLTQKVATLHLGLTDYRTYIATHHHQRLPALCHRALALGNVMVLITADQHVPFIVRSKASATHPMRVALPGGHAEPDDLKNHHNDEVAQLMAVATRNEALEELFLSDCEICGIERFTFLGVVERMPDRKPSTVYLGYTNLMAEQLKAKYASGNTLQQESVDIVVRHVSHLCELASRNVGQSDKSKYVPETLGAAVLYSQMCGVPES